MRAWELTEAIDSSKITNAAETGLQTVLKAAVREIAEELATDLGARETPDEYGGYGEGYMRAIDRLDADPTLLDRYLDGFLRKASDAMTRYIQDYIAAFPSQRAIGPEQAATAKVVFAYRETSRDAMVKDAGGYFTQPHYRNTGFDEDDPGRNSLGIKVFVKRSKWQSALRSAITEEWFGESYENGIDIMIDSVLPTFVHEMSHLEQISRKLGGRGDFTYITTPSEPNRWLHRTPPAPGEWASKWVSTGSRRYGKRGGFARSPNKGGAHRMRYYGSTDELDSFAAGGAAAIVRGIRRENQWGHNKSDFNRAITDAQQALGYGWSDYTKLPQISNYWHTIRDAMMAGEIWDPKAGPEGSYRDKPAGTHAEWDPESETWKEHKFKVEDLQRVWRRFLKLVYQKLESYKHPDMGRDQGGYGVPDPELAALVKQHPAPVDQFRQLVILASREVYRDVREAMENRYSWRPPEQIFARMESNDSYSLYRYTDFIRSWYYRDTESPAARRTILAFNQAVAKRVKRRLAREAEAEAAD